MNSSERNVLLNKINALVLKHFFDPKFNGRNWPALIEKHRASIISGGDDLAFETEVNALLAELGTSHTRFFNNKTPVPGRSSINATFKAWPTEDGDRWLFQDIQPGGPADHAGIKSGDVLLRVNNREFRPPTKPEFRMASQLPVTLIHRNGAMKELKLEIDTPKPKYSECPYAEPQSVISKQLESGVGYLKVSMFPGILGVDFARDVDREMSKLKDSGRLIIDLRGNPGGGIGALRLMSYLTPEKVPVGYSLTRARAERGYRREELPQFREIPNQKWKLPLLAARFIGKDMSIVVVTEGKGPQKFHHRIVVLVNEHTAGSGEMVAAFAREYKLATIVGIKTAGRLLGGKAFNVGGGYKLMLPVGGYLSWNGLRFEGTGLVPEISVDWSPGDSDVQFQAALAAVRAL